MDGRATCCRGGARPTPPSGSSPQLLSRAAPAGSCGRKRGLSPLPAAAAGGGLFLSLRSSCSAQRIKHSATSQKVGSLNSPRGEQRLPRRKPSCGAQLVVPLQPSSLKFSSLRDENDTGRKVEMGWTLAAMIQSMLPST
ncbi:uncharacterized protein PS065_014585 [Dugong dugon]